jgi:hypothetical protein
MGWSKLYRQMPTAINYSTDIGVFVSSIIHSMIALGSDIADDETIVETPASLRTGLTLTRSGN